MIFPRANQVVCAIVVCLCLYVETVSAAAPGADRPFFLGQHLLYNRTFASLQDDLLDGLRIWGADGTTWAEIEEKNGRFDFRRFDDYVTAATSRRLLLMYTFGQTPRWASSRPDERGNVGLGAAAEPTDMKYWARYVRTVATRYKGKISAYEIMNEPRIPEAIKLWSPGFFSGSSETLAEMTKIAALEVRKIDPSAKIVCPSMDGGLQGIKRLDYFLRTGAGRYCDVIGFHYYLERHTMHELTELVQLTRKTAVRYNLGNLPIWDTETGVLIADAGYNLGTKHATGPLSKSFQSDEAANLAAKILIVSHSLGVERTYWFAHDSSWMGSTVADKRSNQLNPFGRSLAVLRKWLSGRYLRACATSNDSMLCEVHDQVGKEGVVYWGSGKRSNEWTKSGYTRVEYLNGDSADLNHVQPSALIPQAPGDVVFLRSPKPARSSD